MEERNTFRTAALSLAALLSTGCASRPYSQIQVAYANTQHEKDLGSHVDLLCVRARGGAKLGAKEPSGQEIHERRDLIIRKIKNNTDYYFQKNPLDPRKQDWDTFLELEKAGQKIVLSQECDGRLYFGLDGISQALASRQKDTTNDVLDLSERIPDYTVPLASGARPEDKHYAFRGLPPLLDRDGKCDPASKEEFRLGADICYGKLPDSNSQQKYSVELPIVGEKETDVEGATSSDLVKIAIPFVEYRLWGIGANFPTRTIQDRRFRSHDAKDLSIDLWAAGGYVIDIAISETDYSTSGGSVDNVPGIDVEGRFYGELTSEITLFRTFPIGMSFRLDENKYITPSFSGGYKIQW